MTVVPIPTPPPDYWRARLMHDLEQREARRARQRAVRAALDEARDHGLHQRHAQRLENANLARARAKPARADETTNHPRRSEPR